MWCDAIKAAPEKHTKKKQSTTQGVLWDGYGRLMSRMRGETHRNRVHVSDELCMGLE